MSNFQLCAIGWQRFCGRIADGRPGGRISPPESHKTAATVVAWQSFPFLFPAVIVGLSQPRRLLGPVFDDARGHIHVGLDSGSAVFETKCVRQFPSIIPGLLFCR